ncbi:bifunctional helix-turn-helix transcriptional regulator/GNAT family N-acetyltransferase [Shewanella submarina]|uniref:GNAT family N-acetyltransferase n=1 Tax=Shewanella submarina TaxID=2016376 RepID=A0ABV7G7L1_9GAMM|nr:bifunctional helix-turn-helix transcriptional regulator/GNAT family N-acetyltransferase [Shewanella submarina]MCL1037102.1 bifunctional helix-turn-helix transcriptional regulator/GNAT family N-acetyltransferase [Shewanella submarina]
MPQSKESQPLSLTRHSEAFSRLLSRLCKPLTQTLGLSQQQLAMMKELERHSLSVKQLGMLLGIDKSNASRTLAQLTDKGWVNCQASPRDQRMLRAELTPSGRRLMTKWWQGHARHFDAALAQLLPEQREHTLEALVRLTRAMEQAQAQAEYDIRLLLPEDNAAMAQVIRTVSSEYGLTPDKGYGVSDPTLDCLSEVYADDRACYWVISQENRVLGGGGIAPLADKQGRKDICELQKMYFLPELRGKGFARRLTLQALAFAKAQGYACCYLETTACLTEAVRLYEAMGFEHLPSHMGETGHDACELPMLRNL